MPKVGDVQGELVNYSQEVLEKMYAVEDICKTTPIQFLKLKKQAISELKKDDCFFNTLGVLITKIANLSGLKSEIAQINKEDIVDLILDYNKHLSLEEIYFAFKLERYNQYSEKSNHYELFGAEYVSEVLKKFKYWKIKNIKEHKPVFKSLSKKLKPTAEQNQKAYENAILECLLEVSSTGQLPEGKLYLYYELHKRKELPLHTIVFKERVKKAVLKKYWKKKSTTEDILKKLKRKALIKYNTEKGKTEEEIVRLLKIKKLYDIQKDNFGVKKSVKKITQNERGLKAKCREYILLEYFHKKLAKTIL